MTCPQGEHPHVNRQRKATVFAFTAAALYALNAPCSKALLADVPPTMMAAFLYLGAGIGILAVTLVRRRAETAVKEKPLTKKELPATVAMVLLDIAAPVFLMLGLRSATAANASLLNNFEIVATSLLALLIFKEAVSRRLWCAIALVTAASLLLSFEGAEALTLSHGSLFVLLACVCWGFENNCTRRLSHKDPLEIVVIKGLGSGLGSLLLAVAVKEALPPLLPLLLALLLGFVAYGLSICFYIYAQRELGAAKTSTYYAVAPFLGSALSLLLFRELPSPRFLLAFAVMLLGTYFASTDT